MFLEDMSVDEDMVKFKGRLFFKHYMPKKACEIGNQGVDGSRF